MFYSHEILTSRKYGVATVWLVATLGAKSGTKKVSRKAILNVDVKKACETIMEPEAPLALRLQSNLLYGVTKVNNQQAEYLLLDTQAVQNAVRSLLKTARSGQLDPNAGKAIPEQLILMDDPAFAIDNALPALAFDFDPDNGSRNDSQRSTQSMLSIRERSGSVSSLHAPSVLGLNISSSSHGNIYQLPTNPFGGSSAQKPFNPTDDIFNNNNDEEMLIMEDDLFDFDADGNMRDIPASEREARRAGSWHPQSRLGSDSAASGRVRKEHEDALAGRAMPIIDGDGDFGMQMFGDEYGLPMLPDADPFQVIGGTLGSNERPLHFNDSDRIISEPEEETSSISAGAPQKRKRAKKARVMQADQANELKNADLSMWQKQYLDNMTANKLFKAHHKSTAQAKKNAFHYVYGAGINGVGEGIGDAKFESPLAMFSGAALIAKLTGSPPAPKAKRGTKRAHEDNAEHSTPSKRPALEDEVGRGYEEDGFMPQMNDHDQSIELGRDAPSALPDVPSSAMPWNQSASLLSHQRGASSSLPGRMGSAIGPGRRLTSASPLVGRGSALPGDLDQFDNLMDGNDEYMVTYGREDSALPPSSQGFAGHAGGVSSSQAAGGTQDFELFGAAAAVDTQTAAESQWVRSVLDKESNNFLEYVKNSIDEKLGDELSQDHAFGNDEDERMKIVTFEELFDPNKNSHIVAAQAFYHILSLATKNRVWVTQEINEEFEPFGEISIGVLEAIEV